MEAVAKNSANKLGNLNISLRKNKNGKINIKSKNKTTVAVNITIITLLILTVYGFATFNYKSIDFSKAVHDAIIDFHTVFFKPSLEHYTLLESIKALLITFCIGVLTTITGAIIAFGLALLSASNLSNPITSSIIKNIIALIRAVPTIIWVLIFAISAGLGSVAAVVGLTFHSTGYLTKAYGETIEEMDFGKVEALRASGANFIQIVSQAIIPTTLTSLVAWTFLRFEINFINALAMGAAAGAGGLGFNIFIASSQYYNLHETGFYTYMILIVVVTIELLVTKLKSKIA